MSPTIKESNTLQIDLRRVNTPSVASKKITLVKAVVIAILATTAIALLYLEVKHRIVSIGISYAVTNPWIMGLISVVAIVGIAYLIYRNMKSPSTTTSSTTGESGGMLPPSQPSLIPATVEELEAAMTTDPRLCGLFRSEYSFLENGAATCNQYTVITRISTLEEAVRKVEYRSMKRQSHLSYHNTLVDPSVHNLTHEYLSRQFTELTSKQSLAIRWLMSPHCIERV